MGPEYKDSQPRRRLLKHCLVIAREPPAPARDVLKPRNTLLKQPLKSQEERTEASATLHCQVSFLCQKPGSFGRNVAACPPRLRGSVLWAEGQTPTREGACRGLSLCSHKAAWIPTVLTQRPPSTTRGSVHAVGSPDSMSIASCHSRPTAKTSLLHGRPCRPYTQHREPWTLPSWGWGHSP